MEEALQVIAQRAELRRVTRAKLDAIQAESSTLAAVGASPAYAAEVEIRDSDRPVEMAKQRGAEAVSALERSRQRINALETELKQLESAEALKLMLSAFVVVVFVVVLIVIFGVAA